MRSLQNIFDEMNEKSRGVAQKGLYLSQLNEIEIPIPPLPEQQRIVTLLDETFAGLAQVHANAERNLVNAREVFDSFVVKAFETGNEKWKKISLGEVVETTQGVQIPKTKQRNTPEVGYKRYLYISDFDHDNNLKYVEDIYPTKIVAEKDLIVVNTGATAGRIFRGIDGILSNNLFRVSFDENILNVDFLYYFVNSEIFKGFQRKIVRGTANPHMGHENFNSTPFFLPPLEEQRAIVERLDALAAETSRLEAVYQSKLEAVEELKKSVLGKAFAGNL